MRSRAEQLGGLAVEEHRAAADEHGGTVASLRLTIRDRPPNCSTGSRRTPRAIVEALRVDDDQVGAIADAQVAGVEAVPVGELAGQPVHGLLERHERRAGLLGVARRA